MSDYIWCHGPDCHRRQTTTRVRGVKGSKVLRTMKINAERQSIWKYFCDQTCMHDFINKVEDFDFIFSASAGYPGTLEWVQYASDPTGVALSTGTTSIMVNDIMPMVNSGQVQGILAGMPGAAEYEALIGSPGIGTSGMDAQSIAHLVIVLFIVFGNITYFIETQRSKKY